MVNGPTSAQTIEEINRLVDVPIIYTVVTETADIASRIAAGVDILNVSGGAKTVDMVRKIRREFPDFPIMATGGLTKESIMNVIEAGANAITYTPPTNGEIFKKKWENIVKKSSNITSKLARLGRLMYNE